MCLMWAEISQRQGTLLGEYVVILSYTPPSTVPSGSAFTAINLTLYTLVIANLVPRICSKSNTRLRFYCRMLQGSFSLIIEVRHDVSQQLDAPGVNHSHSNISCHCTITVIILHLKRQILNTVSILLVQWHDP